MMILLSNLTFPFLSFLLSHPGGSSLSLHAKALTRATRSLLCWYLSKEEWSRLILDSMCLTDDLASRWAEGPSSCCTLRMKSGLQRKRTTGPCSRISLCLSAETKEEASMATPSGSRSASEDTEADAMVRWTRWYLEIRRFLLIHARAHP